ncbi:GntR family transcriptional regulator [Schnuerera ultunensis]|uniref:GntR family transcriptional regulator n=1 Tax=Schnuerera ultunensis TaxID=45497 RepID=UPI000403776B|nr:GntR family transcriptional regulator [Schnuerera ultunensis]
MFDKSQKIPYYIQIRESILKRIVSGELKVGEKLPSEENLAKHFGVSRMTVNKALSDLVDNGYLTRIPGSGTYVSKIRREGSGMTTLGFMESISKKGFKITSKVIFKEIEVPTKDVAEKLNIFLTQHVYHIKRIRSVNNMPIVFQDSYIRKDLCPGLFEYDLDNKSLYRTIQKITGKEIKKAKDRIEAIQSDEYMGQILNVNKNFPLLHIERVAFIDEVYPIELTYSWYRSDQYILEVEYN